jgi:hypothetical protein
VRMTRKARPCGHGVVRCAVGSPAAALIRRTVEKIGCGRIGRPFGAWKLKPSRPRDRGVFHVTGDRDPVRVQTLLLERSQELIGLRDLESVFSSIRVLALSVDGRLVVHVGLAGQDIGPRRRSTGGVIRVDVNVDRASVSLLARPPKDIVLIAYLPDIVNDADHRADVRLRTCGRHTGRCRQEQACDRGRERFR